MTKRGYACIGLHRPKDKRNIGSALRAAGCYDAAMVVVSGARIGVTNTDTGKQYRHRPLVHAQDLFDHLPYDCVPVAVDLVDGALPLDQYQHPERAFYIFGPEDGTLDAAILDRCRDRVMVRTSGCMNLAATVNVVLYDRAVKRGEWPV